jgi:Domain of unknown function (DUF1737)
MSKVFDYVVITSSKGIEKFEGLVKENIRLGWQPVGGVAIIEPATTNEDPSLSKPVSFAQAMVKYEY